MYEYTATVDRVVDGDTLVATVDLGWLVFLHDQKIRLYGVNAPEMNTKEGVAAKEFAAKWLDHHANKVKLRTRKSHDPDKYGRWLAVVVASDGACLNAALLSARHAQPMPGTVRDWHHV